MGVRTRDALFPPWSGDRQRSSREHDAFYSGLQCGNLAGPLPQASLPGQKPMDSHCWPMSAPLPDSSLSGMMGATEELALDLQTSPLHVPQEKPAGALGTSWLPPSPHLGFGLGAASPYPASFSPHPLHRLGRQFHSFSKPQLQSHVPPPPHDLTLKWIEQTPSGLCLLPLNLLKSWPVQPPFQSLPLPACLSGNQQSLLLEAQV